MSNFYTGCGRYYSILGGIASSQSFGELQKYMHLAREHRENCPECIALNKPLAEHLFQKEVVVIPGKDKSHAGSNP